MLPHIYQDLLVHLQYIDPAAVIEPVTSFFNNFVCLFVCLLVLMMQKKIVDTYFVCFTKMLNADLLFIFRDMFEKIRPAHSPYRVVAGLSDCIFSL